MAGLFVGGLWGGSYQCLFEVEWNRVPPGRFILLPERLPRISGMAFPSRDWA
jgi:hypothetical protein